MPRLSALAMRAAQRASANHPNNSPGQGGASSILFCHYCLRPLLSEAVRSRHVANSPFCREAEAAAIENGGASMGPKLRCPVRTDDPRKAVLVESVLDDMPAYITDEVARALGELVVNGGEQQIAGAEGMAGQDEDVPGDRGSTGDDEMGHGDEQRDEGAGSHTGGTAAEVSVVDKATSVGCSLDHVDLDRTRI